VFATATAQRLLQMAGIGFEAGVLTGSGTIDRRLALLLRRLVQSSETTKAAGDHLDIDLPSGARLSLLAVSAAAALPMPGIGRLACLMVELHAGPQDRAAVLRQRYRLTMAEAALAVALGEGRTLRDIAAARDISINTLRVQLQAIFAKTACHRQSDLVRLVLRLPAG
jgi:DNA-binding CsgD family transcriptional regulator